MADKTKKLAAAKKKLKEFQTKQKTEPTHEANVIDSLGNEVQTIVNTSTDLISNLSEIQQREQHPQLLTENVHHTNGDVQNAVENHFNLFASPPQHQESIVETNAIQPASIFDGGTAGNVAPTTKKKDTIEGLKDFFSIGQQKAAGLESLQEFTNHMKTTLLQSNMQPSADYATNEEQFYAVTELRNEKQKNQDLYLQIVNQNTLIETNRLEIEQLKLKIQSYSSLEQQLASHIQTIEILVGDKAELTAALSKYQQNTQTTVDKHEELEGRLNASRHRVQVLEKEIELIRTARDNFNENHEKLCTELENAQEEKKKITKFIDESAEEIAELKRNLSLKGGRIDQLEQELTQLTKELQISQLKVEQFAAGGLIETEQNVENLVQNKLVAEQQLQESQKMIQQLCLERDQSGEQYQNYVQHLNKEIQTLSQQSQELVAENDRLSRREEGLVKHVSDLERQIQQQLAKQKSFKENQKNDVITTVADEKRNALVEELEKNRDELQKQLQTQSEELVKLQNRLHEQTETISHYESTIERIQTEQPDTRNLIALIESDKVAASRAVAQNQELKQQLEELQTAFVQLSNDKLALTDRLQSEQHLGREIKLRFGDMETDVKTLKDKLHFKDEEMIRLSHENNDLQKQMLQLSSEIDHLRHYEAKGQANNVLQTQLSNANETIKRLSAQLREIKAKIPANESEVTSADEVLEVESAIECDVADDVASISSTTTINIPTEEAMEKLQERFTRTMSEIANLTEEKQRLEHLVIQLQGETETIADYIALYQKQRQLLKQREVEKDVQLQQIVTDRESMKEKLLQLNKLVEKLLNQNGQSVVVADEVLENVGNNNEITSTNLPKKITELDNSARTPATDSVETASKILNLLSEIQLKNRTQQFIDALPHEVHHCSCCSGKLETV